MNTVDLERVVGDERRMLDDIAAARPTTTESMAQYEMLRQKVVSHERELCLAKKLPVALPLKEGVLKWTRNHNQVRLSSTETSVSLACEVYQSGPFMSSAAIISFVSCVASKLVVIDYDNIEEHSMFHSGMEGLGSYFIENSSWKPEVTPEASRADYVHFLFCFSTCVVETIAKGLEFSLGDARMGTSPGEGLSAQ